MPLDAKTISLESRVSVLAKHRNGLAHSLDRHLFEALRENTFAAPVVKMQKERGRQLSQPECMASSGTRCTPAPVAVFCWSIVARLCLGFDHGV
jgi:hypothetical protein